MDTTSPQSVRPPPGGPPPAAPVTAAPIKRQLVAKLHSGEHLVAWGRAWISRDGRMTSVVGARTLDFVVVTDDCLILLSIGFFTRQPRKRVYEMPLDRLRVDQKQRKRGHELRISARQHRPLLVQLRRSARNDRLVHEILARTGGDDQPEVTRDPA